MQPLWTDPDERPRANALRVVGVVLLIAGLGANIWLVVASAQSHSWRLAVLILSPGAILLFSAFLAENTPSMRGCLSVFAVLLAFVAAFWAYVGVAVALSADGKPPAAVEDAAPEDQGGADVPEAE